jgi:hypothetical protein
MSRGRTGSAKGGILGRCCRADRGAETPPLPPVIEPLLFKDLGVLGAARPTLGLGGAGMTTARGDTSGRGVMIGEVRSVLPLMLRWDG